MKLREEIEPKLDIAEQRYSEILSLISAYEKLIDRRGDENNQDLLILRTKLQKICCKDMSKFNLWEYWEEEGIEVLAFRISLPDPTEVKDITENELREILTRMKSFPAIIKNESFLETFIHYLSDYYHEFLKLNFKNYNYKYFIRQKKSNYLEYSTDEVVEKLLTGDK